MRMSKWLPLSLFLFAALAAWHMAQPKELPQATPAGFAPSNPYNDSVNTRDIIPRRAIESTPEPTKISRTSIDD